MHKLRRFCLLMAVGLGCLLAGTVQNTYASSATYHKNGHLWYRGHGSHLNDVEVMNGTYKYNPTKSTSTVPTNHGKYFKLYTVSNLPVRPYNSHSKYKQFPRPFFISGIDNFYMNNELQGFDVDKWPTHILKLANYRAIWYNLKKSVFMRATGHGLKYPLNFGHYTLPVNQFSSQDSSLKNANGLSITKRFPYMDKLSFNQTFGKAGSRTHKYGVIQSGMESSIRFFATKHPQSFDSEYDRTHPKGATNQWQFTDLDGGDAQIINTSSSKRQITIKFDPGIYVPVGSYTFTGLEMPERTDTNHPAPGQKATKVITFKLRVTK